VARHGEGTTVESRSSRRRQREREQRRETILHAAEALFAGGGYHATSIEQIADQAEISVGSVYLYFRSKEDILVHLLEEISLQLRAVVGREFQREQPTLESFARAGRAFLEGFCGQSYPSLVILLRESVGQGPAVEQRRRELFTGLNDDIASALTEVSRSMGLAPRSPRSTELIAFAIIGMFERVAYQYLIWGDRGEELPTVAEELATLVLGGVGGMLRRAEEQRGGEGARQCG